MNVVRTCPDCGDSKILTVDGESFLRWMAKEIPVQEAFPELSEDDRERMLTGICPPCWDELAKEYDEDDLSA